MTKSIRRNQTFKSRKSRKNKKNLKLKGGSNDISYKSKIISFLKNLVSNCNNSEVVILNKEDLQGLITYFTKLIGTETETIINKLELHYIKASVNPECKSILNINELISDISDPIDPSDPIPLPIYNNSLLGYGLSVPSDPYGPVLGTSGPF
jgi:hypothetical protein